MKLRNDVSLTETIEGGFVLDRREGSCFALNGLGVHVWRCLKDGLSSDAIVDSLATHFANVPRDTISRDLAAFCDALVQRRLTAE